MYASDHWHNRFSISTLGRRLRSVPMLLVLIPFVVGIILADSFTLPLAVVVGALIIAVITAWRTVPHRVSAVAVALALVLLGWIVSMLGANTSAVPYNRSVEMQVEVVSPIAQRDGYGVADGRIVVWYQGDERCDVNERVRLWIEKEDVEYGDVVELCGVLRPRISRYSDYDELLYRRGYAGGVAVAEYNTLSVSHHAPRGLQSYAIEKLSRYAIDTATHSTVEAMVAGSRYGMPRELSDAYSRTGLAHLMAVSGLHLGIVLLVINMLLLPLRLIHAGHRIANVIAIVALWLFVGVCGASASVVRAALMLSVLQLSLATSSRYNSLNALAASLFMMLLYRTDYLYDISFQLSALAVVGIIVWAVPLLRITTRGGLYAKLLVTLVMGVAATLWTMPLVSHTFGHIALVGVIITPIAMLCAYVIVAMGIMTLLLPHPLALPFGYMAEYAAYVQNRVAQNLTACGITGVDYSMSTVEVVVCYMLFIAVTLLMWSINRKKVVTLYSYDDLK